MPEGTWIAIGGIIGAMITATITYLTVRRRNSGKIDTTDAAVLWTQSQTMRQELRDQLEKAQGVNDNQGQLIASLTATNEAQAKLIVKLTATNQAQATIISELKDKIGEV